LVSYCQIELIRDPWKNIHLEWSKIEITLTQEEKIDFLNKYFDYEKNVNSPNTEPGSLDPNTFHILDLNGDFELDVIQYRESTSLGEYLVIFLNEKGKLNRVFNQYGKILRITRKSIHSPLEILIISCLNSGFLTYSLDNINFIGRKESLELEILKESTLIYPDELEYPEKQTINIPFRIKNDVYKLRKEPKIDSVDIKPPYKYGNLIAEFTKGDLGHAFASKKDETGRIWWFVAMENNIKKDWTKFNHCDNESEKRRNMRVFGWISSTYVEIIK
jgi:hypothetical protein